MCAATSAPSTQSPSALTGAASLQEGRTDTCACITLVSNVCSKGGGGAQQ